jgi:hypothetical protein
MSNSSISNCGTVAESDLEDDPFLRISVACVKCIIGAIIISKFDNNVSFHLQRSMVLKISHECICRRLQRAWRQRQENKCADVSGSIQSIALGIETVALNTYSVTFMHKESFADLYVF